MVEDVAGLVLVQRMLVNRRRATELWVRPAGVPGRKDWPRQARHEVHLPRIGDGLQSRDLVDPVQGRRLGLPRGAHAPVVRPAFRGPAAPKDKPPWASQCPPSGPRYQRHTDLVSGTALGRHHFPARKACWKRKGLGAEARFMSGSHSSQSQLGHACFTPPLMLVFIFSLVRRARYFPPSRERADPGGTYDEWRRSVGECSWNGPRWD